ncbi:hypothetical protein FTO74_14220 [Granulicella sp. WH15]|uniref:hypothetical protein n=1 Tax=Granulicella sp. WH15 TaxID=2602070 RepID=UPI00136794F1|nr:hypothetical protein [Granulicella sp. WH15]QHN04387.1 hypothetical protein FTO74_14220 [Granulicella sp. WH15]
MTTYRELGTQIGELVDEKNTAYGSSFEKCGEFMRLLYPNGVPPERMDVALLLVRIFDKQVRIATDEDAFGESPFKDIAGYGLLGAKLHQEKRDRWQDNASGPVAANSSKAPHDSAGPSTKQPTTTNESGRAVSATWQQLVDSSPLRTAATAPTATADASQSEEGHVNPDEIEWEVLHALSIGTPGFNLDYLCKYLYRYPGSAVEGQVAYFLATGFAYLDGDIITLTKAGRKFHLYYLRSR